MHKRVDCFLQRSFVSGFLARLCRRYLGRKNHIQKYLESQFLEGMCWDNYGIYGWHIDHKIPLCSAKNETELLKLFHYTNLQPLWAEDNLKKNGNLI